MTSDKSQTLLQAVGMAEAADEPIDLDSLADELSTSVETIRFELDQLQGMGLISLMGEEEPPRLQHAGSQMACAKGRVEPRRAAFPAGLHRRPVRTRSPYPRGRRAGGRVPPSAAERPRRRARPRAAGGT